jgi:hypothetical protein
MDNDNHHSQKTRTTSYAVIAIVAALALLGVVVLTMVTIIPLQQAEAGCERALPHNPFAFNESFISSHGQCSK